VIVTALEGRPMMFTATRIAALVLVVVSLATGCASRSSSTGSPSAMATAPNVQTLAGRWDGWMKGATGNTAPVQVMVNPDGSYTSQMGASSGSGTIQVVDGKIMTKGHLSGSAFGSDRQSVVTVVEKGGRPTITGEGRNDAGPYSYELTKRN
jgi:hypothetical protein